MITQATVIKLSGSYTQKYIKVEETWEEGFQWERVSVRKGEGDER